MRRRELLGSLAAASSGAFGAARRAPRFDCGCALAPGSGVPPGSDVFKDVGSKLRITGMKAARRVSRLRIQSAASSRPATGPSSCSKARVRSAGKRSPAPTAPTYS